jgi:hypothetical protein
VVPLGPRRKAFAAAVVTIGLLSFFLPLIKVDVAVLNKTRWSAFDIAVKLRYGQLPPSAASRDLVGAIPIMIPALYFLQLVALFSLAVSRSPVILKNIAFLGICSGWLWRTDQIAFEELFYGTFSYQKFSLVRRVEFGQHTLLLLGVMGLLWFIAANADLDTRQIESSRRLSL